ncbi:MAG TPA: hypothetical protein VFK07_00875, partial [Candidatus Paceibacterota bacterium]|nr:hypothetical protein [Candidatus Paceibacterota bacterium]
HMRGPMGGPPAKKPDPYELIIRFRFEAQIVSDQSARALTSTVLGITTMAFGAKVSSYTLRQGGKIIDLANLSLDKGLAAMLDETDRRLEQTEKLIEGSLSISEIDEEIAASIDAERRSDDEFQEELAGSLDALTGR